MVRSPGPELKWAGTGWNCEDWRCCKQLQCILEAKPQVGLYWGCSHFSHIGLEILAYSTPVLILDFWTKVGMTALGFAESEGHREVQPRSRNPFRMGGPMSLEPA